MLLLQSKIDFFNSLVFGLPKKQLDKLQRILNAAARITTKTKKCEHISPVLPKRHWLPVTKMIEFKILTTSVIFYRSIHQTDIFVLHPGDCDWWCLLIRPRLMVLALSRSLHLLSGIDHFTVVCSGTWPLDSSEAGVDLVLIQTSLLLLCKCN